MISTASLNQYLPLLLNINDVYGFIFAVFTEKTEMKTNILIKERNNVCVGRERDAMVGKGIYSM